MLKVYLKPLKKGLGKTVLKKFLNRRFMYSLARAGLKSMKDMQRKSSDKGASIRKGMSYTIGKSSITFYLSKVGYYHNYGVRRHKMKYLLKSGENRKIIPIKQKGQPVRFRTLTRRAMKKHGTWTHPGMKPKKFLEDGIEAMKATMRKRIATQLGKYLTK